MGGSIFLLYLIIINHLHVKINQMKKIFICSIFLCFACQNSNVISLTKVEGSPLYEDAKLTLNNNFYETEDGYSFSFALENYKLGVQTLNDFEYQLANSAKGQHIHFIINNGPYFAKYSGDFVQELEPGNNVVLAFLSRSYHESVKNENAYYLNQIGNGDKKDLSKELLFYSRPKGVYKGEDTDRVLLDFYLINTQIGPEGNKVRATIQDSEFIIDEWAPYYIEGLPKGKISIKLELINSKGDLIESPFNTSLRTVTIEE